MILSLSLLILGIPGLLDTSLNAPPSESNSGFSNAFSSAFR